MSALIIILILILLLMKLYQHFTYWKKRNIITITRFVPSSISLFIQNETIFDNIRTLYEKTAPLRYFGTFSPIIPMLFVRDLDLIKQITTSHFEYFSDHDTFFNAEADEILKLGVGELSDVEMWRKTRKLVSPFFTSKKLNLMHQVLQRQVKNMLNYLENKETLQCVSIKELMGKIVCDNTAGCMCAQTYNSYLDQNNIFYQMVNTLVSRTFLSKVKSFLPLLSPKLAKVLKIEVIPHKITQYFAEYTQKVSEYRKKHDDVSANYSDLINIMMDLRKQYEKEKDTEMVEILTDNFIASQEASLFIGASGTTTFAMCFAMYELAKNPDVQEKLFIEIEKTIADNDEKILTFSHLKNMTYLNNVINEVLRKWPPLSTLPKRCTKDFVIPGLLKGEKEVVIKKGTMINIPIVGIHHDPKYYPNPEKFDPDRFDKSSPNYYPMVSGSYLPFGLGPRNCVGQRFAILQMQTILTAFFQKYRITTDNRKLEMSFTVTTEMTDNMSIGLIKRMH